MIQIKLFLLVGLFVCFSENAPAQQNGLTTNDVSLLFPLKNGLPYPPISLADEKIQFVSFEVFEQILKFENPTVAPDQLPYINTQFISDLSRWYITSFRIDDCGDQIDSTSITDPKNHELLLQIQQKPGCQPRLRVVAQPFNFSGQPLPSALHLLYQIKADHFSNLIRQLLSIKNQSQQLTEMDKLPLQIHPGLTVEAQTLSSNLRDLVSELFKSQRPLKSNLDILTMTLSVSTMNWKMVGGYVKENKWQRFVTSSNSRFYDRTGTESILLGVEEIKCNFYEFCATFPKSSPQSIENDNLLTPALSADSKGQLLAPRKDETTQIAAEKIDSVQSTHFFNTNCLSCHVSSAFRDRERLHQNDNLPQGITPFTLKNLLSQKPSMIINFGYEGLTPNISIRTANEANAVANRINQFLKLQNPSPEIHQISNFWNCLMSGLDVYKCYQQQ